MTKLEKRLRIAGVLIAIGLLLELTSLFWHRPLSFFLFVILGGTFCGAGILFYLYSLVTLPVASAEGDRL